MAQFSSSLNNPLSSAPSDKYIDYPGSGANEFIITAPADGYFNFEALIGTNQYVQIINSSTGQVVTCFSPSQAQYGSVLMPCAKGNILNFNKTGTGGYKTIRFVYSKDAI